MINVIGISVLNELRKYPGFEHTVIAGGFCRDSVMGGKFKDIDIFLPIPNTYGFKTKGLLKRLDDVVEKIDSENNYYFGNFKLSGQSFDLNNYTGSLNYVGKVDGTYRDIPIQIMEYNLPEKDFAKNLIKDFSYYVDQAAWDGEDLITSPRFLDDVHHHTATLCQLHSENELPGALRKFERLKAKYPEITFRTIYKFYDPHEVKKQENKQKRPTKPMYSLDVAEFAGGDVFNALVREQEIEDFPPARQEVLGDFINNQNN